jgi:hypothetical protein
VPCLLVIGCVADCLSGVARLVGGWVWYRLVLELLVKTLGLYGLDLLVRVSWLRLIYDLEVVNIRRNGVAKFTQKIER